MHKAERFLFVQKLDHVLDNNNKLVLAEDFVKNLKKSQRLRDCYIINLQIWTKFFKKRINEGGFNTDLISVKVAEVSLVAKKFQKGEWTKIFLMIEEMKSLIPGI